SPPWFPYPCGCAWCQAHALARISSRLENRGRQPRIVAARPAAATSSGGSPGRRGRATAGIARPVTRRAASATASTEYPTPVPRFTVAVRPLMGGRPGGIEIAQVDDAGAVRPRVVREHALEVALRLAIGVDRRQGRVLGNRRDARMAVHRARR